MINSPCNNICTKDPNSELCKGCSRTQVEIANWLFYNDNQKKNVLNAIKNRNKNF